jgi:hypothetical protein
MQTYNPVNQTTPHSIRYAFYKLNVPFTHKIAKGTGRVGGGACQIHWTAVLYLPCIGASKIKTEITPPDYRNVPGSFYRGIQNRSVTADIIMVGT